MLDQIADIAVTIMTVCTCSLVVAVTAIVLPMLIEVAVEGFRRDEK